MTRKSDQKFYQGMDGTVVGGGQTPMAMLPARTGNIRRESDTEVEARDGRLTNAD